MIRRRAVTETAQTWMICAILSCTSYWQWPVQVNGTELHVLTVADTRQWNRAARRTDNGRYTSMEQSYTSYWQWPVHVNGTATHRTDSDIFDELPKATKITLWKCLALGSDTGMLSTIYGQHESWNISAPGANNIGCQYTALANNRLQFTAMRFPSGGVIPQSIQKQPTGVPLQAWERNVSVYQSVQIYCTWY
jgi:hypothetical protein